MITIAFHFTAILLCVVSHLEHPIVGETWGRNYYSKRNKLLYPIMLSTSSPKVKLIGAT